jgi:hypothetical protein
VLNFGIPAGATGATGAAGPNSVTGATTSDGMAILNIKAANINNDSGASLEVTATNDTAITAIASGIGVAVSAGAQETCAELVSQNESAIRARSNGGTYTIESLNGSTLQSAIERVRGWFVWLYSTFTGRLKTADITANRDWTLPDADGDLRIAPIVVSANYTARAGQDHIVVATATLTDPTPSEGAWYRVIVRNGTATVGGTAYATSGTIIERSYHSGAWANRVYNESPVLGANVATFLATPSSANLAAAVTDETGTGSVVFANSPTFTGTPLIGTKTILSENGFQRAFLGSDYTVATTSITNKIPSFSISVVSGKTYKLEIMLKVTGVAGSTHNANLIGSFNLTAAESSMLYRRAGFETENFVSATTPYQGFALFNTTGTATQICFLDGIIKPSSSGTLEVYLNSGSATNSVTMLKGAYIEATLLD